VLAENTTGTSLNDIAAASASADQRAHFPSKAVYQAMFERALHDWVERINQAIDNRPPVPSEWRRPGAHRRRAVVRRQPQFVRLVRHESLRPAAAEFDLGERCGRRSSGQSASLTEMGGADCASTTPSSSSSAAGAVLNYFSDVHFLQGLLGRDPSTTPSRPASGYPRLLPRRPGP
jgi:AcrR family transcriptional regulator